MSDASVYDGTAPLCTCGHHLRAHGRQNHMCLMLSCLCRAYTPPVPPESGSRSAPPAPDPVSPDTSWMA